MSRHQAVRRMINKGDYQDDEDEYYEEDEQEQYDKYADSNFEKAELVTIKNLQGDFKTQFTREQIIDVLYLTEGDYDATFDKLTEKWDKIQQAKNKKESRKQHKNPTQQQQATNENKPELTMKVFEEQKIQISTQIQRKDYQIVFDLEKFNQPYPKIVYEEPDQDKRKYINLVVVGHVDSGKSSLIGRLLHQLKLVDERELFRNQKEAQRTIKDGKQPFVYAFITDESQEEKDRLVTMDIGYKVFKLNNKYVNLLDSPGHQDFVPNMITGACQADYAILVIDSNINSFESGFVKGGQTKEHAYLLRSLGVKSLIVGLNKMDLVKWDQSRFQFIKDAVSGFLSKIGYKEEQLIFIPYSAVEGENMNEPTKLPQAAWYKGPCIFQALDSFEDPQRADNNPTRMTIHNCYNQIEGKIRGTCLFGKVESGRVQKGQKYVILPQGILCQVKEILEHDQKVKFASTGAIVDLGIQMNSEIEFQDIRTGDIISSIVNPIPVSNFFICEIVTLELDCPIIKGQPVIMHINGQKVPAIIKKLNKLLDRFGNMKKQHPRTIGSLEQAEVEIETQYLVCLETFKNSSAYGKIILRHKMSTLAVGKITQIKLNQDKIKQTQSDLVRKNSSNN